MDICGRDGGWAVAVVGPDIVELAIQQGVLQPHLVVNLMKKLIAANAMGRCSFLFAQSYDNTTPSVFFSFNINISHSICP